MPEPDSALDQKKQPFGALRPWGVDDLPEPLPYSLRNVFRVIGPGAILLAASIGGGEWLVGPAMTVKYGMGILWIATVAIILQLLLNLEAIRYTLYTGEPILIGVMRLAPGSKFWAVCYSLITFAQLGVPALAASCAAVLFASGASRVAVPGDESGVRILTYVVIALGVVVLCSGKTVERILEITSWFMIAFIMLFLFVVNVFFVPPEHSLDTLLGFFEFGYIPKDVDLLLLATFAATAGSGGVGNLTISNWFRDKGFGMGAKVGAIHSAFSGDDTQTTGVGKVFPLTEENLRRWRGWWKYTRIDQVWLWAGGCFVGMYLNVNLATYVITANAKMDGIAAGALQAEYLAQHLWSGFWILGLMNGFWILFSTHLGNTDILVRTVTDILWIGSPGLVQKRRMTISRLYYLLLAAFTAWGCIAINFGNAMDLFKMLGFIAGVVLAIAAVQVLWINTTLLPPQLRPPLWRRLGLVVCGLFYATFSAAQIWSLVKPLFVGVEGE